MYFLLIIVILISVYIYCFKDNFTKEKIDKSLPVIAVFAAIIFILCIFSSIVKAR